MFAPASEVETEKKEKGGLVLGKTENVVSIPAQRDNQYKAKMQAIVQTIRSV